MGKSLIIVGAGIGGLTAGCFGQINGYDTCIFEMHDKPGGLCTAWERKGYTIDACLHWLVGSAPGSDYYKLWQEIGAIDGKQIINMDQFYRIEDSRGKSFTLYTDLDRLEQQMKDISPEDTPLIKEFTKYIRRFAKLSLPINKAPELYNFLDYMGMMIKMLPYVRDFRKWGRITMSGLASRFKSPLLRQAFEIIWPPEFSSIFILMTLAWMANKDAGYIIGGSMAISRSMEKRYLNLGGKTSYKSKVTRVLVENNRTIGVRLADGTEHRADYIISAADGHATIFDMLEGKYIDDKIRGYYDNMPIFQPLVFVGLGVNRSFEDLPEIISGIVIPLEEPIAVGGKEQKWMSVRVHNFDPTLAPAGKTLITIMFESEFSYWESLNKDLPRYKAEKEAIAKAVITSLDRRFPGLAGQVEMWDVATPVTFNRYTGNWQGSYEGWLLTPQNIMLQMKKTLPGLGNFYMVGQWVQPGGGLPSGLMTGYHAIQILCKKDGKKLRTSVA